MNEWSNHLISVDPFELIFFFYFDIIVDFLRSFKQKQFLLFVCLCVCPAAEMVINQLCVWPFQQQPFLCDSDGIFFFGIRIIVYVYQWCVNYYT